MPSSRRSAALCSVSVLSISWRSLIDPLEQLARLAMVDLEAPLLGALEELHARADRQPAGDLAGGHPAHAVGHDEQVAVVAGLLGERRPSASWSRGSPACG